METFRSFKRQSRVTSLCSCIYLRPPAGQHEVRVHIFFTELLCYIETQRPILIINVSLCGIGQYRVCIIDLFKLFCCLWIIRVFIRMIFQRKFPAERKKDCYRLKNGIYFFYSTACQAEGDFQVPVGFLNLWFTFPDDSSLGDNKRLQHLVHRIDFRLRDLALRNPREKRKILKKSTTFLPL